MNILLISSLMNSVAVQLEPGNLLSLGSQSLLTGYICAGLFFITLKSYGEPRYLRLSIGRDLRTS